MKALFIQPVYFEGEKVKQILKLSTNIFCLLTTQNKEI